MDIFGLDPGKRREMHAQNSGAAQGPFDIAAPLAHFRPPFGTGGSGKLRAGQRAFAPSSVENE
jgi:hypothetical protein